LTTRPTLIAAVALTLAAVLAGGPVVAAPSDPPTDGPAQTLDPNQAEANDRAVLPAGHIDIGPRYRDGKWTIQIHDDSAVPSVWRSPADTVLQVRDTARRPVPDDPGYAFLGEKPGTNVYVVPQTQQQDVVWIGWNTQDPGVLKAITRGVTMDLRGVQGPGRVTVYLQSGNLGAPQVLWNSTTAFPQPLWVETNTHTHANWVFAQPGIYLLAVDISADLADGSRVTGGAVLRFAVGDQTEPDDAFTAAFTTPLAAASSAAARPAADDPGTRAWLPPVLIGAGALIIVVILGVALRAAAVRRRAERQRQNTAQ
jgi:putative ABC transporter-associated repeat protein